MKIESKFMTKIVSRIVRKLIKNKFGYDLHLQLNGLRTTILEDKAHVHLDVEMELTKDELNRLLNDLGM